MDKAGDPSEWKLDALAAKMVQYCPLMAGLTGAELQANSNGNFEVGRPRGVGCSGRRVWDRIGAGRAEWVQGRPLQQG